VTLAIVGDRLGEQLERRVEPATAIAALGAAAVDVTGTVVTVVVVTVVGVIVTVVGVTVIVVTVVGVIVTVVTVVGVVVAVIVTVVLGLVALGPVGLALALALALAVVRVRDGRASQVRLDHLAPVQGLDDLFVLDLELQLHVDYSGVGGLQGYNGPGPRS
jgi:hypothetical protein